MFSNLILIIVILINVLIFNYTLKLEKKDCKCSKTWYRNFIKYYALITIIMVLFILLNIISCIKKSIWKFIHTIYSIIGLLNIYILFKFSQDLYKKKCECSNTWEREFIYYYSMIFMLLYCIMISCLIFNNIFKVYS